MKQKTAGILDCLFHDDDDDDDDDKHHVIQTPGVETDQTVDNPSPVFSTLSQCFFRNGKSVGMWPTIR